MDNRKGNILLCIIKNMYTVNVNKCFNFFMRKFLWIYKCEIFNHTYHVKIIIIFNISLTVSLKLKIIRGKVNEYPNEMLIKADIENEK